MQLKEFNKKDNKPTSLFYNDVIWNFQEEYKPNEDADTDAESDQENNQNLLTEEDLVEDVDK